MLTTGPSPSGQSSEAYEVSEGLFVRGQFHSTPKAQLLRKVIRERLERGKDVAMSIGFQITDDEFDSQKSVRMLKEIELFEVSVVRVPANPLARVASVKAIEAESEAEELIEARRVENAPLVINLPRRAREITGGSHAICD